MIDRIDSLTIVDTSSAQIGLTWEFTTVKALMSWVQSML